MCDCTLYLYLYLDFMYWYWYLYLHLLYLYLYLYLIAQYLLQNCRENVLGVGNYCYVASARRRARRLGAHGEERGGAYRVATHTACFNRI